MSFIKLLSKFPSGLYPGYNFVTTIAVTILVKACVNKEIITNK